MGKLVEIKTKQNDASVEDFLGTITDEQKRDDALKVIKLMQKASKQQPRMWGASIIGFGQERMKSPTTGREVDWFTIGFSPRKSNLSLYFISGFKAHAASLKKLGKFKTSAGCLYINKLSDINPEVLEKMIHDALKKKNKAHSK